MSRRAGFDMTATKLRAVLSLSLMLGACAPPAYVEAPDTTFRSRTPPNALFDVLYRRAVQLGYVIAEVDAATTTFSVQSQVADRSLRGRRRTRYFDYGGRMPRGGRGSATRLVVEITDDRVRVHAVGAHAREDGTVHPAVAEELRTLEAALEQASTNVTVNPLTDVPAAYAGALPPPEGPSDRARRDGFSVPAPIANVPTPFLVQENPLREPLPAPALPTPALPAPTLPPYALPPSVTSGGESAPTPSAPSTPREPSGSIADGLDPP